MKYCIIVPHYKHEILFEQFLPYLAQLKLPCIVVDDGSGAASIAKLTNMLASYPDFHLVQHQSNRGKGAAVITGCYHASAMGFSHVLQLDADGQHNIEDAEKLLNYSKAHPSAIISGQPYFDETAPFIRKYGRKITDFWVALETLSFRIKDGLCGFRVYPLKQVEHLFDNYYLGPRMDFDPELLVKAVWANINVHFIPTKVIYHENTVSHFHYLQDNLMLIRLHVRLMFGMLIRLPRILYSRIAAIFR
ncbi:glycosyltransferase family 2 protein [Alteromonas ponticola]|uniref:Glycosyltransferase family 2 protein n=1 Tax=Alteromonas aquimaris TaxID=2998417 RepID=A0ABT3P807_9ALTE|nr:glycosyltransferase family 2 protein [Alteromonas aquimaris]MCW8108909.1 glycosyltransferase family 2 protein [Alteromonas aquimaris]